VGDEWEEKRTMNKVRSEAKQDRERVHRAHRLIARFAAVYGREPTVLSKEGLSEFAAFLAKHDLETYEKD
jgi:hypothetical protein